MSGTLDDEKCPGCGHPWTDTDIEYGCEHGWEWNEDGTEAVHGCDCRIVHLILSRPL